MRYINIILIILAIIERSIVYIMSKLALVLLVALSLYVGYMWGSYYG